MSSIAPARLRVSIVDPAAWSLAYDEPLARALARAGCDVTIHCTRSPHGVRATMSHESVRIDECFYRTGYGLGVLPRRVGRALQHPLDLAKLLRRLRREADIVMVQWLPGGRVDARAWARCARHVPVTFTAHNAQERTNAIDPSLLRGFSAVIAHSDGGAAALRDAGVEPVWRMQLGAYTQYATLPDPDDVPVAVSGDDLLVVMPGLLRPYKGVDVLLAAWPSVAARVPRARLVIAGRPMGVSLPASPPGRCTLLPRFLSDEELGWLLRRADVCCLPYTKIDMSGVAAAALACDTPLVLSDVGGFGEFAGAGGVLVPPGDRDALADRLVEVLTRDELRTELRDEARAAVTGPLSWDSIARSYLDHFDTLRRRRDD